MRSNAIKRYLITAGLALSSLWLIAYYVGFGTGKTPTSTHDLIERQKLNERLQKLVVMVKENQEIMNKLKDDVSGHRSGLVNKIRSEISAQARAKETDVPFEPTHKSTSLKPNTLENQVPLDDLNIQLNKPKDNSQQGKFVIPIVITACNRPSVARCLDKLFSVRDKQVAEFPVVVSQDCGDEPTAKVLEGYGDKITFIKHEAEPVPAGVKTNLVGYYKISSHYKFAISRAFEHFPAADSVIILEDDIDVGPDFLSYFVAMHELMAKDETLWCASAWNDNGKVTQVNNSQTGAETLYRTDFFPGLGWLLKRSLWQEELSSKWPQAYWDDWMRQPAQRKGRACIRPEISRTSTFGRKGVSAGQFFDSHLKYIKLNEFPVDWGSKDLSYLIKANYDKSFRDKVYKLPVFRVSELKENKDPDVREVRVEYTMPHSFKAFAKDLGLMTDFKSGVPRTAYLGIVSTLFWGRRVYLAPPQDWSGYDEKWS